MFKTKLKKSIFLIAGLTALATLTACGGGAEGSDIDNDMLAMNVSAQVRDANRSVYNDNTKTLAVIKNTPFAISASVNSMGQQSKIIWNIFDYNLKYNVDWFYDNINDYKYEDGQRTDELVHESLDPGECVVYSSGSGALTNNSGSNISCTTGYKFYGTGVFNIAASGFVGAEGNISGVTKQVTVVVVNNGEELNEYVKNNF